MVLDQRAQEPEVRRELLLDCLTTAIIAGASELHRAWCTEFSEDGEPCAKITEADVGNAANVIHSVIRVVGAYVSDAHRVVLGSVGDHH